MVCAGGWEAAVPGLRGISTFRCTLFQGEEVNGGSKGFKLGPQTTTHIIKQTHLGQDSPAAVILAFLHKALLSGKERQVHSEEQRQASASYSKTVADRTGHAERCVRLHPGIHKSLRMTYAYQ